MRKTGMVLIIDDDDIRIDRIKKWYNPDGDFVYSPRFSIELIEKADVVFLDHDLGYGDVYDMLRKTNMRNVKSGTRFYIHSMNPVGAQNIANLLRSQGFQATVKPFSAM